MAYHRFFATCPKGLEELLVSELADFGGTDVRQSVAGAAFCGTLGTALRACLWSRLANRVLLALSQFLAGDAAALYEGVMAVHWLDHIGPDGTLAVDFSGTSGTIAHTHFGAQKVKDAIVDQIRSKTGRRPSVDLAAPSLRVNVRLHRDEASVCVDLSGHSLHRRGYREPGGEAPLKENVAAAVLLRAGWPAIAAGGGPFLDPMCGSGTFLVEAALIAADIAPGLFGGAFGFETWAGHDGAAWRAIREEALSRREAGLARGLPPVLGYDADPHAVVRSRRSADRAGLARLVRVSTRELSHLEPPPGLGLLAANPPYGERAGDASSLAFLYRHLGGRLRDRFAGWRAAVFTGDPDLGKTMGIRAAKRYAMYNGAIPCRLLLFRVEPEWFVNRPYAGAPGDAPEPAPPSPVPAAPAAPVALGPGGAMLANRLRKNLKSLGKWAAREGVSCYRLYDADMKEYAFSLDLYGDHAVVQEYAPPPEIDADRARDRLDEAVRAVGQVLGIPPDRLVLKRRERHRAGFQHGKLGDGGRFLEVGESGCRFLVNLADAIDTGLFLDQRPLRRMIRDAARGKRFLNLFCYTATATVLASAGGARNTTSVDLSRTHIDWARRNLALNGMGESLNRLVRADCSAWLEEGDDAFDLILLDPPTFSNSKGARRHLDVQRDHPALIRKAVRRLAPGGTLFFSCNFRRFRMDSGALRGLDVRDVTRASVDKDFQRDPRVHSCWEIRKLR